MHSPERVKLTRSGSTLKLHLKVNDQANFKNVQSSAITIKASTLVVDASVPIGCASLDKLSPRHHQFWFHARSPCTRRLSAIHHASKAPVQRHVRNVCLTSMFCFHWRLGCETSGVIIALHLGHEY